MALSKPFWADEQHEPRQEEPTVARVQRTREGQEEEEGKAGEEEEKRTWGASLVNFLL